MVEIKELTADLCAIGAGSSGLAVAGRAARLGARSILIERDKMGGDCLNYGCVPSKALLAAGHAAAVVRNAGRFGIRVPEPWVDGAGVMAHVHEVQAAIAPSDSVERFEALGVTVVREEARFLDHRTLQAGPYRIRARHFVICTGTTAHIPPISGLNRTPYLTNETIFAAKQLPSRLLIIGAGSIGVEIAQAHRNLGVDVAVLEVAQMLGRDDPELVDILRRRLRGEGVEIIEEASVIKAEAADGVVSVEARRGGQTMRLEGSHLLVATGRRPNVSSLNLENAGVRFSEKGVEVDRRLRTTNPRVYAVGDVTGHHLFAHVAGYQAWIVLRNTLFRIPAKVTYDSVPQVTFTHPELAWVGLSETEARRRYPSLRVVRWPFSRNDRAQCDRETEGLVKVLVTPKGQVISAGIIGPAAGEQILTWAMMVARRIPISALVDMIVPYPTYGYASRYAAEDFTDSRVFGPVARRIVNLLSRL